MPGKSSLEAIPELPGLASSTHVVVLTMQDDPALRPRGAALPARWATCSRRRPTASSSRRCARRPRARPTCNPQLGAALASAEPPAGQPVDLTEREAEVLRLIALGHTNAEIAASSSCASARSSPTAPTSSRSCDCPAAPSSCATRSTAACCRSTTDPRIVACGSRAWRGPDRLWSSHRRGAARYGWRRIPESKPASMASQRESSVSTGSALRPLPVPRHRRTHPLTAAYLPERVLIAYDGRSEASGALAMGADVAAVAGSELIIATVESEATERALPDLESAARECLGDRSFRVITKRSESVPAGLQELAEDNAADLMVLGSTRRTGLRRVLPRQRRREGAQPGARAIGVAPPGHASRDAGLQVVGVGYDGSPESIAALRLGTAIASAGGGVLRILTVAEPMGSLLVRPPPRGGPGDGSGGLLPETAPAAGCGIGSTRRCWRSVGDRPGREARRGLRGRRRFGAKRSVAWTCWSLAPGEATDPPAGSCLAASPRPPCARRAVRRSSCRGRRERSAGARHDQHRAG